MLMLPPPRHAATMPLRHDIVTYARRQVMSRYATLMAGRHRLAYTCYAIDAAAAAVLRHFMPRCATRRYHALDADAAAPLLRLMMLGAPAALSEPPLLTLILPLTRAAAFDAVTLCLPLMLLFMIALL